MVYCKRILAEYILLSNDNAQRIDDIIHPAVAADFQRSGLDWLESAIFFDSGSDRRVHVDKVVCVTAPQEVRIARIMHRDGISRREPSNGSAANCRKMRLSDVPTTR